MGHNPNLDLREGTIKRSHFYFPLDPEGKKIVGLESHLRENDGTLMALIEIADKYGSSGMGIPMQELANRGADVYISGGGFQPDGSLLIFFDDLLSPEQTEKVVVWARRELGLTFSRPGRRRRLSSLAH